MALKPGDKDWKTKREMEGAGGRPGKLHDELGIPEGQRIPKKRLEEATRSRDPEIRRDAIRARTMEGWRHKGVIDLDPVFNPKPR